MPVNKNAYKRYLIIHNLLEKSIGYPIPKDRILKRLELAGFKISSSMFEKDLESLRKTFNLPIKYDFANQGYCYTDLDVSFDIPMSDDVIKTIYGALSQLALFQNTKAFRNAKESLEKIMSRLEIDLKMPVPGKDDIIFYEPQTKFCGSEWITFIMFNNHSDHNFEPYALKEISGRWYVLGAENEKVAVYGLDRVVNLKISDHYYTFNEVFRNKLFHKIRYSVGHLDFTKRTHEVQLLYDNSVAHEVLSTKIPQRTMFMDEHNLLISVKVSIHEDFVRRAILAYGDKVVVTGPPFATDLVLKILNATLHRYDDYSKEHNEKDKPADTKHSQ
ncbi:MAG: WYL domain-containing protein [Bacteroidetes bacterium]|nr:WYL domain-containing protein [Bacteroidota bacterium]